MICEYFAHETAIIDAGVSIGEGTRVWHFCHVLPDTTIGFDCVIGQSCIIGPQVDIGSGVKVKNNVTMCEGVEVEDDVFIGDSTVFTNLEFSRAFRRKKEEYTKTLLKKGCSIGPNTTIASGVVIGEYALIDAGSLVKLDVKPYARMTGVPTKQVGWVGISGETLEFKNNKTEDEYAKYELLKDGLGVEKK